MNNNREQTMRNLLKLTVAGMMMASPAISGGWEASRLDTSMMYTDGGYAEVGTSSITYDVNGTIQDPLSVGNDRSHKMAKDQNRTAFGFKMQYDNFDVGLTNYLSGAIQLDGQGGHATAATCAGGATTDCSVVPSADVEARSTALMARYRINENMSVIGGLNRYSVSSATVTTLTGYYVVSGDEMAPVAGAAYENKEIALRVELLVQAETDMSLDAKSSLSATLDPNSPSSVANSTLVIPQTMTLNFQSGIAEDTLVFGSIHKADWDTAQIAIPENTAHASGAVDAVGSSFASRTAYSLGIGRKLTDNISVLGSYSSEDGGGATSNDPFTLTDGSQTIGLGARYTKDNMTISGGYSYTKVGDVAVTHLAPAPAPAGTPSGLTATYADNKVTGIGLKVGFSF